MKKFVYKIYNDKGFYVCTVETEQEARDFIFKYKGYSYMPSYC